MPRAPGVSSYADDMPPHVHRVTEIEDGRVNCANCGWVRGAPRKGALLCSVAVRQQRGDKRRRIRTSSGYVRVWVGDHWEMEHRQVMSRLVGRDLLAEESVHHINGVRDDNRPENLELWSSAQPSGQRVSDKLAWAREMIRMYG